MSLQFTAGKKRATCELAPGGRGRTEPPWPSPALAMTDSAYRFLYSCCNLSLECEFTSTYKSHSKTKTKNNSNQPNKKSPSSKSLVDSHGTPGTSSFLGLYSWLSSVSVLISFLLPLSAWLSQSVNVGLCPAALLQPSICLKLLSGYLVTFTAVNIIRSRMIPNFIFTAKLLLSSISLNIH